MYMKVNIAEADWRAILDNNLNSTILVCQSVAKGMIERGAPGRIITLSSGVIFRSFL